MPLKVLILLSYSKCAFFPNFTGFEWCMFINNFRKFAFPNIPHLVRIPVTFHIENLSDDMS